jgi:hypothetical protein
MSSQKKGRIAERLIECYINDELIPSLKKKEGWTDIIYTQAWFKMPHSQRYPESFMKFEEEMEARVLISNGFCPTKEFLEYFKKLTASLSNIPDGFLIKMKRTETSRKTNEAIKEFDLTSKAEFIDSNNNPMFSKFHKNKMLPVVNGKIEVVEVKSGKGNPLQIHSYRNAAAKGYPLRLFHVDLNSSKIKEKLIVNPNEIIPDPIGEIKTQRRIKGYDKENDC